MTNKELRRLSRTALIDLLIEQTERNDELQAKIDKLERQVKNRTFTFSSPSSIADAAAELNKMLSRPEPVYSGPEAAFEGFADTPYPEPATRSEEPRPKPAPRVPESPVDWETHLGAIRSTPASASTERSRSSRASSSGSRSSGRGERAKKPESKSPPPRRDERSTRSVTRAPASDPFSSAPLDDTLNKAFNEMLRRNSR